MTHAFRIIDEPQRSAAWFQARLGRLTGSSSADMLATIKSGEAASRRNLRLRLVLERLTGKSQESEFISPAMQAGLDREADAFAAYEALTGGVVERVGFVQHVTLMAGCSPDGHQGNFTRLLSIKCRQPAAHYEFLKSGTIPGDAIAQLRHEFWVTGALTADYFSWNPDFEEPLQARLATVHALDLDLAEYERKALAFLAEVDTECEAMRTLANPSAQLLKAVGC